MRELNNIIAQYEILKSQKTGSVLATVVHVEGSSYRRAGARMLVDEFGTITGAISGGCLEGDALRKALHALHQQKNKLITYDTSDEDDAVIGAQLGCNGIIQVLFEPLDYSDDLNPCELMKKGIAIKSSLAIPVLFNLNKSENQIGTTLLFDEKLNFIGKQPGNEFLDLIKEQAQNSLETNRSNFTEFLIDEQFQYLFIQYYQPPLNLVIVGAGNDAQILSQQAEMLGWEVTVTDGRRTHANEERFASSCQIIVAKPEDTLENIKIDNRTCFVLMSHNYNYDLAVLKLLLIESEIPYIGILGPLKKYERMQHDLDMEGIDLSENNREKIHAPIGLEIGAETPVEIGLSILAEIQSVLTGTSAKSLKFKSEPIHEKRNNQFKQVQL